MPTNKVPQLYKVSSCIARKVFNGEGSLKDLVFQVKRLSLPAIFELVTITLKNSEIIDSIISKSELLKLEKGFDEWLARVFIAHMLWRNGTLNSQSKAIQTFLKYELVIRNIYNECISSTKHITDKCISVVHKPRYCRINMLKISVDEAVDMFEANGYKLIRHPYKYQEYLDCLYSLKRKNFMRDFHVLDLFVFAPGTKFNQHSAYLNGMIALQDKASCIPARILNPPSGATVLDMCAAPGMKTIQMAALMFNQGRIYAAEKNETRYKEMQEIVQKYGASDCVQMMHIDSTSLEASMVPNVEYILVDPSCSGSGICSRLEYDPKFVSGSAQEHSAAYKKRITNLNCFQIKILRHALCDFPDAKRVVYSTCSLNARENEHVVRQVLLTCPNYKIVPVTEHFIGEWLTFGDEESYPGIGANCLYARPEIDRTDGFFIAVFERLNENEFNPFYDYSRNSRQSNTIRKRKNDQTASAFDVEEPKSRRRRTDAENKDSAKQQFGVKSEIQSNNSLLNIRQQNTYAKNIQVKPETQKNAGKKSKAKTKSHF